MASPVSSISRQEVSALLRQVQGNQLFNRQLSSVCQVNGLKSTGVKAELQRRIVDRESLRVSESYASPILLSSPLPPAPHPPGCSCLVLHHHNHTTALETCALESRALVEHCIAPSPLLSSLVSSRPSHLLSRFPRSQPSSKYSRPPALSFTSLLRADQEPRGDSSHPGNRQRQRRVALPPGAPEHRQRRRAAV